MTTVYRSREPIRFDQPSRVAPTPNNSYPSNDLQVRPRQQGNQVNVVITPPGQNVWDFEHPWTYKLGSCCSNAKQCCFAFFCPCCFEYSLHKRAGENPCTCMCPCALFALRSKVRTAFRIEGDLCDDCCVSAFCPCCTAIQMTRELVYQGL